MRQPQRARRRPRRVLASWVLALAAGGLIATGAEAGRARRAKPAAPKPAVQVIAAKTEAAPALTRAYAAFAAGDLAAASDDYAALLQAEPHNADALHGMAAIALRRGQLDDAADYYQRASAADPADAVALAGLAGLRGHTDPLAAESRLKSLIAAQPQQHLLHFALGNVFGTASRWPEAQQAFFHAYSADPGHPDYIFNLAVSLDQLRQSELAAQYYERAVAAARHRPAAFDPAQATARRQALRP